MTPKRRQQPTANRVSRYLRKRYALQLLDGGELTNLSDWFLYAGDAIIKASELSEHGFVRVVDRCAGDRVVIEYRAGRPVR